MTNKFARKYRYLSTRQVSGETQLYIKPKVGKTVRFFTSAEPFTAEFDANYQAAWNAGATTAGIPVAIDPALKKCIRQARNRSHRHNRDFSLKLDYVRRLYIRQAGKCAISGLDFKLAKTTASRVNPYQPSIDRINNEKGYISRNVRLVLYAVNIALNDIPMNDYIVISRAVSEHGL
ncbi:hypothetical protein [Yoonia sp. 208BN28-4]|uniref:hypothetical protein n=1 Tax=Yoonia sp. 208BN28-4 TaxID=3126505 RepID=UPI0030A1C8D7